MKTHLETAPVWDAVRQTEQCPFCALSGMIEKQSVERFLGGAVMEPDIRIRTNAAGFCPAHHRMLMAQKDYHGYALMMDTRLKEAAGQAAPVLQALGKGGLFGRNTEKAAQKLRAITSRCLVCESMKDHVKAYRETFFRLYREDGSFRAAFAAGHGVCLNCLPDLLTDAGKYLSGERQRDFLEALSRTAVQSLNTAQEDLDALCSSFHVGSEHKNNPRCRGALERAVNLLRGSTFDAGE